MCLKEKITFKDAFDTEGPVSLAGQLPSLQAEAQASRSLVKLNCQNLIWTLIHQWKIFNTQFIGKILTVTWARLQQIDQITLKWVS